MKPHPTTHKEGQGETTEAIEAIKKTARRHKWWEGNQSDRNFKEKSASNGGAVRDPGPEDGAQERERAAARG